MNLKYLTTFENYNEESINEGKFIEKGSLLDIAWNIITLGNGERIMDAIKDTFSVKLQMLRNIIYRVNRILENILEKNGIPKNAVDDIKDSSSTFKSEIRKLTAKEDRIVKNKPFFDALKTAYAATVEYAELYEIDENIKKIKDNILAIINNIKFAHVDPTPEEYQKYISDFELLITKTKKLADQKRKILNTKELPRYEIQNLTLRAAQIIGKYDDEKRKRNAELLWQKGKNQLFERFKNDYAIKELEEMLDLSKLIGNIKEEDKVDVDKIAAGVQRTTQRMNSIFNSNTGVKSSVKQKLFLPKKGYYFFNFTSNRPHFGVVFYYKEFIDKNVYVLIPFGLYNLDKGNDGLIIPRKIENTADIPFNLLNTYNTVFFYIKNMNSFVIYQPETNTIVAHKINKNYKMEMLPLDQGFKLDDELTGGLKSAIRESGTSLFWKRNPFLRKRAVDYIMFEVEKIDEIIENTFKSNIELNALQMTKDKGFKNIWSRINNDIMRTLNITNDASEEAIWKHLENLKTEKDGR
jgi:hypothetical protein